MASHATVREGSGRPSVVTLDARNNSLNLLRLVFAFLVLVAHSYPLSGEGDGNIVRGGSIGGWAVIGFFAISGYLITASRLANPFGHFLLLRVARIYPAFLVCLVFTASVFAPIAYQIQNGTLAGFLTTPTTPVSYVLRHLPLHIVDYDVAGTPSGIPYAGVWNGSLWTLFHEFCCYLLIGIVLCLPFVRRHRWLVGVGYLASLLLWANVSWLPTRNATLREFLYLLPIFLGGATVQILLAHVPLRHWRGIASGVATLVLVVALPDWGWQAAAPFLAYTLLWLSTVVPSPALVKRHDISYGVYIYAFPVQQTLVYTGVLALGLSAYDAAAIVGTTILAVLSWRIIELPALRRARRGKAKRGDAGPEIAATTAGAPSHAAAPVPPPHVSENPSPLP